MRRWPKKRRFYFEEDGRRYSEKREMSAAWLRRRERYLEARGFRVGGILFRRVDLPESAYLLDWTKPRSMPRARTYSARTPPRRRARGTWVEVRE